jgi:pyridoxine 4-dehydrogenase
VADKRSPLSAPLGKGLLGGQFKSAADLSQGDFRNMMPRYQGDNLEANIKMVTAVEELAQRKGCTPAQIAINWVLALSRQPGMPKIIPIPGTTKIHRLEENLHILDLTEEDMRDIDRIQKENPVQGDRYHAGGMAMMDT